MTGDLLRAEVVNINASEGPLQGWFFVLLEPGPKVGRLSTDNERSIVRLEGASYLDDILGTENRRIRTRHATRRLSISGARSAPKDRLSHGTHTGTRR
jgi:hypothetical protein